MFYILLVSCSSEEHVFRLDQCSANSAKMAILHKSENAIKMCSSLKGGQVIHEKRIRQDGESTVFTGCCGSGGRPLMVMNLSRVGSLIPVISYPHVSLSNLVFENNFEWHFFYTTIILVLFERRSFVDIAVEESAFSSIWIVSLLPALKGCLQTLTDFTSSLHRGCVSLSMLHQFKVKDVRHSIKSNSCHY